MERAGSKSTVGSRLSKQRLAAGVERPNTERPNTERANTERASTERASTERPSTERPSTERPSTERASTGMLSTGIAPLDAILPGRGFCPGTLVEWLSEGDGSCAGTLLFQIAARIVQRNGNLVVVDPAGEFYPPAANRLGIELRRTLVVRPHNDRDAFWALEQSLRCSGVAVVVGCLSQIDDRVFRRLQLAVERGGGLGLLLRAARFRSQPSWADARLHVAPLSPQRRARSITGDAMAAGGRGRRLRVELLRSNRGSSCCLELERTDETGTVHLVTELATTKVAHRAARA